jgi:hypothetical protein
MSTPPQIINAQNLHLAPPAKKCASKRQTTSSVSTNNQLTNSTKPFTFGQNTTNNLVNLFSSTSSSSTSGGNVTNNPSNNQSINSNTSITYDYNKITQNFLKLIILIL